MWHQFPYKEDILLELGLFENVSRLGRQNISGNVD